MIVMLTDVCASVQRSGIPVFSGSTQKVNHECWVAHTCTEQLYLATVFSRDRAALVTCWPAQQGGWNDSFSMDEVVSEKDGTSPVAKRTRQQQ